MPPPSGLPGARPETRPPLLINELQTRPAPGTAERDWLELWNSSDEDVSLAGWRLIDGSEEGLDEDGAVLIDPSLTIPAGGYLVLFADASPNLGPTHVDLGLSGDGELLELRDPLGNSADRLDFGPLLGGWSFARNGDGSDDWLVVAVPTPGAPNGSLAPSRPVSDVPLVCDPLASAAPMEPLEGETVTAELTCEGDALDDFDVEVLSTVDAGTLDGPLWTLTTDADDAGRLEVLFVLKPSGRGGMPETARARVDVVDDWTAPGNTPPNPATYQVEWGLPVLHIDPDSPLSQQYVEATAWWEGVEYDATIKIRGASSSDFPKNHFTLEFEPTQIDMRDLGIGRKDHLVLISNFDDVSHVRQKLVYDAWEEMAAFRGTPRLTPRTAFVVVYLAGAYHGLYVAIDHIDDEFMGEMNFDDAANLYKSVNHNANYYLTNSNGQPKSDLRSGWEKKEGPDGDWTDLEGLTSWAGSVDPETFAAEAEDWLDVEEFADWLLLVHHFAANDSAGKNAYVYNEPANMRFRYVPWDFNHALGQDWRTRRVSAEVHDHFANRNAIFASLLAEPVLEADTWEHYALLRAPGAPLSAGRLAELVASYYDVIHRSAQRDWTRWGDEHIAFPRWADLRQDDMLPYEGERAYLETWIAEREGVMETLHPMGGAR